MSSWWKFYTQSHFHWNQRIIQSRLSHDSWKSDCRKDGHIIDTDCYEYWGREYVLLFSGFLSSNPGDAENHFASIWLCFLRIKQAQGKSEGRNRYNVRYVMILHLDSIMSEMGQGFLDYLCWYVCLVLGLVWVGFCHLPPCVLSSTKPYLYLPALFLFVPDLSTPLTSGTHSSPIVKNPH